MKPARIYLYARAITVLLSTSSIAAMSLVDEPECISHLTSLTKSLDEEIAQGDPFYARYKNVLLDEELTKPAAKHAAAALEDLKDAVAGSGTQYAKLVTEDLNGNINLNPLFKANQQTFLEMNDLSYAISKRQGYSDEMNHWIEMLNKTSDELLEMDSEVDACFGVDIAMLRELEAEEYKRIVRQKIAECEAKIMSHGRKMLKYREQLLAQGWELRVIEGRTGYKTISGDDRHFVEDDRGFVAYHPSSNLMTVVYHGSRNDLDWKTNFDSMRVKASAVGLELPEFVETHRGFGYAVASTHNNARDAIMDVVNKLDPEKRSKLKIVYTGHSQGAAVSQLAAVAAADTIGKEIFGPEFRNSQKHAFQFYGLSVPKVFAGKKTREWVEDTFGKDNMIRQNVHGDPVPIAFLKELDTFQKSIVKAMGQHDFNKVAAEWALNRVGMLNVPILSPWLVAQVAKAFGIGMDTAKGFIRKMPQFNALFERNLEEAIEDFAGYESIGHLALDDVREAHKRNLLAQTKSFFSRFASNTKDVVKGYYSALTGNKTTAPGLWGLLKNTFSDAVYTFVAPFHYGSTVENAGGSFDPGVVGRDIPALLGKGKSHQALKLAAQEKA